MSTSVNRYKWTVWCNVKPLEKNALTLRLTKVLKKLNLIKLNGASSYQTGKDLIVNLLKQASFGEYISKIA